MTTFAAYVEDDDARLALVLVEAADADDGARRIRYLLEPTSARLLTSTLRSSSLTPAMAERLA